MPCQSAAIKGFEPEKRTFRKEEFVIPTDSLEEVFENREQIEISKFYERLPKPHSIAIKELQDESLHIANAEPDPDGEDEA